MGPEKDSTKDSMDPEREASLLAKIRRFNEALLTNNESKRKMMKNLKFISNIFGSYLTSSSERIKSLSLQVVLNLFKATTQDQRQDLLSLPLATGLTSIMKEWHGERPRSVPYYGLMLLVGLGEAVSENSESSGILHQARTGGILAAKLADTFLVFANNSKEFAWSEAQADMFQYFWDRLVFWAPRFVHFLRPEGKDEEETLSEIDFSVCQKVVHFIWLGVSGALEERGWNWERSGKFALAYLQQVLHLKKFALAVYDVRGINYLVAWLRSNNRAKRLDVDKMETSVIIMSLVIDFLNHGLTMEVAALGTAGVVVSFLTKYHTYVYSQTFSMKQDFIILMTACDILTRLLSDPAAGQRCLFELQKYKTEQVLISYKNCKPPTNDALAYLIEIYRERVEEKLKLQTEHEKVVEELSNGLDRILRLAGEPTEEEIRHINSRLEFQKEVDELKEKRRLHEDSSFCTDDNSYPPSNAVRKSLRTLRQRHSGITAYFKCAQGFSEDSSNALATAERPRRRRSGTRRRKKMESGISKDNDKNDIYSDSVNDQNQTQNSEDTVIIDPSTLEC